MTQQITVKQEKKFFCFICGTEIIFKPNQYKINKKGRRVKKQFNLDGTEHICNQETKEKYQNSEEYKNSSQYQDYLRRLRAYWARKNGKYDKYDNTEDKKSRRKKSEKTREEYKQKYYNESLDSVKALEILEIVQAEFFKLNSKDRWNLVRLQYRKMALKYHPDRNKDSGASAKFIQATEAYELLESVYKI